ncbi:MAG: hypothetical protein E6G10_28475 [Actinobacteria bacterium]|nr:MAG: hypothetical protein E6G10_28475 [Actinomycetota bacterium]
MTRLRLGACLSLTGRYGLVGERVELRIEDDASDPEQLAARFPGVARRSDLLLGPYSTQLMRRAGALMADIDGVLWNQGGSGDDVQAACPGRIVSVLAPTSRYSLPFVRRLAEHRQQVPLWVVRARGKFGRQVAAGAVAAAKREGLEVVEERADEEASFTDVPDRWDLFCVGMFEDDVALVRSAKSAARPPRMICSVAAGRDHGFLPTVDHRNSPGR